MVSRRVNAVKYSRRICFFMPGSNENRMKFFDNSRRKARVQKGTRKVRPARYIGAYPCILVSEAARHDLKRKNKKIGNPGSVCKSVAGGGGVSWFCWFYRVFPVCVRVRKCNQQSDSEALQIAGRREPFFAVFAVGKKQGRGRVEMSPISTPCKLSRCGENRTNWTP